MVSHIKAKGERASVKSRGEAGGTVEAAPSGWTFLTNHTHVLVCLSRDPQMRLRDVAQAVGITERAVQKIVAELEAGGILTRERDGRRNSYQIHRSERLRHSLEAHRTVGDLLEVVRPA